LANSYLEVATILGYQNRTNLDVGRSSVLIGSPLRGSTKPASNVWNQIRIETRTAPKRLDELLSLDPEPPRAQSDVLDLPFEELTGGPDV
jgi:hypothetical protein